MCEYEAYCVTDFPLIFIGRTPRNNYGNQKNKCKEKLVISQSIRIIVIKSKEARVIIYTCRYSSGHLIPIIQQCQNELGIKCSLEYLQVQVITLVSLLFITIIPMDCTLVRNKRIMLSYQQMKSRMQLGKFQSCEKHRIIEFEFDCMDNAFSILMVIHWSESCVCIACPQTLAVWGETRGHVP